MALYFTTAIVISIFLIYGSNAESPDDLIAKFLSGVEPEKVELLNRLNNIMNNTNISAESKQKLEVALSSIGKRDFFSGISFDTSGHFYYRGMEINKTLVPLIHHLQGVPRSTTECCCKVTRWWPAYRQVRAGSTRCGLWGWNRCTRWRREQYQKPYNQTLAITHMTFESAPDYIQRPCSKDREVCCEGFVSYKRCCTNIDEINRMLDLFESQRDLFDSFREFLITLRLLNPDACHCGP